MSKAMKQITESQSYLLCRLYQYSGKYEISIQFAPYGVTVSIAKDGKREMHYGGDFDSTVPYALDYLDRITAKK